MPDVVPRARGWRMSDHLPPPAPDDEGRRDLESKPRPQFDRMYEDGIVGPDRDGKYREVLYDDAPESAGQEVSR